MSEETYQLQDGTTISEINQKINMVMLKQGDNSVVISYEDLWSILLRKRNAQLPVTYEANLFSKE